MNKKYIGNPLGYFNDQYDAQLKKAQDTNVDNVVTYKKPTYVPNNAIGKAIGSDKTQVTKYKKDKPISNQRRQSIARGMVD
jgi:DNA invertase Pin-like site-specific DNA recombinase